MLKIRLIKKLFFIILLVLTGCKVAIGTNESEQFKVLPQLTGTINFLTLKKYFLDPNCTHCHSWASDEAAVQQRLKLGSPESSLIYQKVKSGAMPPNAALSTKQLDLLERYILQVKEVKAIEIMPSFKSVQFHLIGKSCLSCHNDTSEETTFEGYVNVKKRAKGILKVLISGETRDGKPMPPFKDDGKTRKAPNPTPEIIKAFKDWVDAGAPNN